MTHPDVPLPWATPQHRADRRAVDVGGRQLAMLAMGSGTPTVVLENAIGGERKDWRDVQEGIALFTHVVGYDRAARGASDPAPTPRTVEDLTTDLRSLIDGAGLAGPFVLVGASVGGLVVRLFAHRWRAEVAGLVLVETLRHGQHDRLGAMLPPPGDPREDWESQRARAVWTVNWHRPGTTPENIDLPTSFAQMRSAEDLGALPLTVLSGGLAVPAGFPATLRRALQVVHDSGHRDETRRSSQARHLIVEGGGPDLLRQAPQAIVDAVRSMVQRVRQLER